MRDNQRRYKKDPSWEDKLRITALLTISRKTDGIDYGVRNRAVLAILANAVAAGYKAGIRVDPNEPEWPVVFVELPNGQVSWHVPQHEILWDGHDKETANARIDAFIEMVYKRDRK